MKDENKLNDAFSEIDDRFIAQTALPPRRSGAVLRVVLGIAAVLVLTGALLFPALLRAKVPTGREQTPSEPASTGEERHDGSALTPEPEASLPVSDDSPAMHSDPDSFSRTPPATPEPASPTPLPSITPTPSPTPSVLPQPSDPSASDAPVVQTIPAADLSESVAVYCRQTLLSLMDGQQERYRFVSAASPGEQPQVSAFGGESFFGETIGSAGVKIEHTTYVDLAGYTRKSETCILRAEAPANAALPEGLAFLNLYRVTGTPNVWTKEDGTESCRLVYEDGSIVVSWRILREEKAQNALGETEATLVFAFDEESCLIGFSVRAERVYRREATDTSAA